MKRKRHISKAERIELKSQQLEHELEIQRSLATTKLRFKKFDRVVEAIFNGVDIYLYNDNNRVQALKACYKKLKSRKANHLEEFKEFLLTIFKNSKMEQEAVLIYGLFNLYNNNGYWLRDYKKWRPKSKTADSQFQHLTQYLLFQYPTPLFLIQSLTDRKQKKYINWLLHIAGGGSLKQLQFPLIFSKKMRNYFLQTSAKGYSIPQAIRKAQVLGLGGDEMLADRIAFTRLGYNDFRNEEIWEKFIHLLINAGMFNYNKIPELLDFMQNTIRENGTFNMKGRTLASLTRMSDEWHGAMYNIRVNKYLEWERSAIFRNQYTRKGKKGTSINFMFKELLNSKELKFEGMKMSHCVGSYAPYCARKRTAIFSLRKHYMGAVEWLATIEVNLSNKTIVQAKYKFNKVISEEAGKVMMLWASDNNIKVGKYVQVNDFDE